MNARRVEHFATLLRRERARVVAAGETAALHDVDVALRLIRESPHDYGICARCGRPIPDARLELLPATRICGR